jgi:hypothetical protein
MGSKKVMLKNEIFKVSGIRRSALDLRRMSKKNIANVNDFRDR